MKLSPNDSYFYTTWKIPKRILSWQPKCNKCIQSYLLATSNVSHFSTKKESMIMLKMTNFWWIILTIFHDIKNVEIYFSYNKFACYVCSEGEFSSGIYRDGIKNIFYNIWRTFRMAKIKHSNHNFKTGFYYMQINNIYIIWTKELLI